ARSSAKPADSRAQTRTSGVTNASGLLKRAPSKEFLELRVRRCNSKGKRQQEPTGFCSALSLSWNFHENARRRPVLVLTRFEVMRGCKRSSMPSSSERIHETDFCSQIAHFATSYFAAHPDHPFGNARIEGFGSGSARARRKDLRFFNRNSGEIALCGEVKLPG